MASPQVNGDVSSVAYNSAFIQHLLDYPLISDGVSTFQANEYGQKSIKLSDSAYKKFATPIIPYFAKPYEYVAPYVSKADSLGDATLGKIDSRFPVVKKPTADLYADTKGLILMPYNKGMEEKDHVLSVYSSELKKLEQQGLIAQGKAAVVTAIILGNETLSWISTFLTTKKAEASQTVSDKVNQ